MSQALFSSITGLKVAQAKLDVIADNIANMGTTGFKGSKVNFENIFVRTLSSGSSNINPMQIGLGATLSEITRNFSGGTPQTTGRATDLNIQGDGFFTVKNVTGGISLTRAGNFSINQAGNLTTPQGLAVLGTANISSTSGSTSNVRIPQLLKFKMPDSVEGDNITTMCAGSDPAVSVGKFSFKVEGGLESPKTTTITIDANSTMTEVASQIKTALTGAISSTASINVSALNDITTGKFKLSLDATNLGGVKISFGDSADTSNFFSIMGFKSNLMTSDPSLSTMQSIELKNNSKITVDAGDNTTESSAMSSFSVAKDGSIEATYSNGCKLSVSGEPVRALTYKTATGTEISGSNLSAPAGGSVSAVKPEELQIQLCNVANPKGLLASSGNLFTFGPGSGNTTYAAGSKAGLGLIDSGGLESANIDLPTEFAEMMLAQRGIEASSRMFSTQSQIMQQIVNLGR
jgi:flagellar hook protein FlgE